MATSDLYYSACSPVTLKPLRLKSLSFKPTALNWWQWWRNNLNQLKDIINDCRGRFYIFSRNAFIGRSTCRRNSHFMGWSSILEYIKTNLKVIMGSWGLFLPSSIFNRVFPFWFKRKHFRWLMVLLTVGFTGICLINPELNHSALHIFSVPSVAYTIMQVALIYYQ